MVLKTFEFMEAQLVQYPYPHRRSYLHTVLRNVEVRLIIVVRFQIPNQKNVKLINNFPPIPANLTCLPFSVCR